ncbi:DUF4919 domain-containing protein [Ramlibacter sp.]|uniref:DUF4919 domain-containing protein n=1 Tax=Ramlibacter sp. TaxID=1917967 RepID=UPI002FCBA214
MASRAVDRYAPLDVRQMREQELGWLALAREKRAKFLQDRSFVYGELVEAVQGAWTEAARLFAAGQPAQALAALRELEKRRPIEDIPTPKLLRMYSLLLGHTGDTARQIDTRGLIFGVQQAIAHSGDGLGPATAVHVILLEEEYDWLREKKLKPERQSLKQIDGQHYDVMTVRDEQGRQLERYFNVTALFGRHADMLGGFDPDRSRGPVPRRVDPDRAVAQ